MNLVRLAIIVAVAWATACAAPYPSTLEPSTGSQKSGDVGAGDDDDDSASTSTAATSNAGAPRSDATPDAVDRARTRAQREAALIVHARNVEASRAGAPATTATQPTQPQTPPPSGGSLPSLPSLPSIPSIPSGGSDPFGGDPFGGFFGDDDDFGF